MFTALLNALGMAFAMDGKSCGHSCWALRCPPSLAIVSHREMSRLLHDDTPRSIGIALALGAASSSCSYAAVAIARSIFRRRELHGCHGFRDGIHQPRSRTSMILIVLMAAEAIAAPIMVAIRRSMAYFCTATNKLS